MAGKTANEEDGVGPNYRLGDLQIGPAGRQSGERPVERAKPAAAEPAAPANANGAPKRTGTPRNLTLTETDTAGPALELDLGSGPVRKPTPAQKQAAAQPAKAAPAQPAKAAPAQPAAANADATAAMLESFGAKGLADDFEDGTFANLPALDVEKIEPRGGERVKDGKEAAKAKQTAEAAELEVVRALAGFGEAPDSLLNSVRYAAHVTRRLIALRGERAKAQLEVQRRAEEHNAALAAMGQALMAIANQPALEPLRSKVARVHDERTKAERAGVDVQRTREDNQRAAASVEGEASVLREKLEPFFAAEREAAEAHRRMEEELRRAQAMLKRAEIELRVVTDGDEEPNQKRLDALELQLTQRRGAVGAALEGLADTNAALGKARNELALQRGSLDAVEDRRAKLMAAVRAREAEVEGQKRAADGAYEGTLRELAEAARQQKLETLVQPSAETVRQTEATLNQVGNQMMRFNRAFTLYDRSSVIKGYALVAVLVAGLIAVWVLR